MLLKMFVKTLPERPSLWTCFMGWPGALLSVGSSWLRMIITKKVTAKPPMAHLPVEHSGLESVLRRFFQDDAPLRSKTNQQHSMLKTISAYSLHLPQHLQSRASDLP